MRLADGRVFCGELPAWRHRALQLGMLHAESEGLVELTPGTRPPGAKVKINRRTDARHYLPGGAGGRDGWWLERLLEHAEEIVWGEYAFERFDSGPREEAFVSVAPRTEPRGGKDAVAHTRFLWLDVDKPDRLPALWDFLTERPCHLVCECGIIRRPRLQGSEPRVDERWRHVTDGADAVDAVGASTTYDMYDMPASAGAV